MHINAILMDRMMCKQSIIIIPCGELALIHATRLICMGMENIIIMPPGGLAPMHDTRVISMGMESIITMLPGVLVPIHTLAVLGTMRMESIITEVRGVPIQAAQAITTAKCSLMDTESTFTMPLEEQARIQGTRVTARPKCSRMVMEIIITMIRKQ